MDSLPNAASNLSSSPATGSKRHAWIPFAVVASLVLLFDRFWIDAEDARRGILCALSGLGLWLAPSLLKPVPARSAIATWRQLGVPGQTLTLLTLWTCISAVGVWLTDWFGEQRVNGPAATQRAAYFVGLWFVGWLAYRGPWTQRSWSRAILPVLAVTTAYGLLQAFDLDPLAHWGNPRDAVSTLANRNVAGEWAAIAGAWVAVVAVHGGARALDSSRAAFPTMAFTLCTLIATSAWLRMAATRGALVALVIATIWIACTAQSSARHKAPVASWRRRVLPLVAVLFGLLIGELGKISQPAPRDVDRVTQDTARESPSLLRTASLEVRREVWGSTLSMWGDAFVLGHSTGQFRTVFPIYRTSREIEISSEGRRFRTEVETAHNDYLQLAAEGGLVAVVLLLAGLSGAIIRRRTVRVDWPGRAAVAPILAFAALACIRSPLGNAPAACLAAACIGLSLRYDMLRSSRRLSARRRRQALSLKGQAMPPWMLRCSLRVFGTALLVVGVLPALAQTFAAGTVRRLATEEIGSSTPPATWLVPLDRALTTWGGSADLWSLRGSMRNSLGVEGGADDYRRSSALAPYRASTQIELARDALGRNDLATAATISALLMRLDPLDPEARVLASAIAHRKGRTERAIWLVKRNPLPHPTLLPLLSSHFEALAADSRRTGRTEDALQYTAEAAASHAARAINLAFADPSAANLEAAQAATKTAIQAFGAVPWINMDQRPAIYAAATFLTLDRPNAANSALESAKPSLLEPHDFVELDQAVRDALEILPSGPSRVR